MKGIKELCTIFALCKSKMIANILKVFFKVKRMHAV